MSGIINSAGSKSGIINDKRTYVFADSCSPVADLEALDGRMSHYGGMSATATGSSQGTRTINGYNYFDWPSSGTFVVAGSGVLLCDILIVGGGGGAGYWGGCGGGGGAVYERFNYPFFAGTYTVTTGAGGTTAVVDVGVPRAGANGSNSSIGTGTVLSRAFRGHIGFGGGAGGAYTINGKDGGCGGGLDDDTAQTDGNYYRAGKGIDSCSPGVLNSQIVTPEHKRSSHASSPSEATGINGGGGGGAGGMNGTYTEDSSPPVMQTQSEGGHGGHGGVGKYISWVDTFAGENDQGVDSGTRGYFGGGGHGTAAKTVTYVPGGAGNGTSNGGRNNTGGGANADTGSGSSGGSGLVIVRYKL